MFVGRESELESLRLLLSKRTSSLVACRGRRRIGKSTLIGEFARRNGCRLINIDGLLPRAGMTNQVQLDNFIEKLSAQTGVDSTKVSSWFEAFVRLDQALVWNDWTVVLLDEVSWMGRYYADIPAKLKSACDTLLKRHDRLIVVICGSVSTWIKKNILENTGFAGRFSRDIVVRELPLSQCKAFWGTAASRLAPSEIIDVLSVTGGIPRYLEEVNPGLSANENIKRMCFERDGVLFGDFKAIFSQVFGEESVLKQKVLQSLIDGPRTCIEVAEALDVGRGGSLSDTLEVLVDAGFVTKDAGYNPETGKKARTSLDPNDFPNIMNSTSATVNSTKLLIQSSPSLLPSPNIFPLLGKSSPHLQSKKRETNNAIEVLITNSIMLIILNYRCFA